MTAPHQQYRQRGPGGQFGVGQQDRARHEEWRANQHCHAENDRDKPGESPRIARGDRGRLGQCLGRGRCSGFLRSHIYFPLAD